MHIVFTEEELRWIKKDVFSWPLKNGCPSSIKKSIEKKKAILNNQEGGLHESTRIRDKE